MADTYLFNLTTKALTKNSVAVPARDVWFFIRQIQAQTTQATGVAAAAEANASLQYLIDGSTTAIFAQDGGTGALGNNLNAIGVREPQQVVRSSPGDTLTLQVGASTISYICGGPGTVSADLAGIGTFTDTDSSVVKVGETV